MALSLVIYVWESDLSAGFSLNLSSFGALN